MTAFLAPADAGVPHCQPQGPSAVVTGVAKASGMIEPDMATMLAHVVTEAVVSGGP